MGKKKINIIGIVFLCVAVAALVLAIVGMVTPALASKEGPISGEKFNIKLFGNDEKYWNWELTTEVTKASPTLSIIGFIVTIIGAAVVIVDLVLKNFLGKNIKFVGFIGGAAALIGGILVLVGGLVMANNINTLGGNMESTKACSIAIGTILGLIAGIAAAAAGALGSTVLKN